MASQNPPQSGPGQRPPYGAPYPPTQTQNLPSAMQNLNIGIGSGPPVQQPWPVQQQPGVAGMAPRPTGPPPFIPGNAPMRGPSANSAPTAAPPFVRAPIGPPSNAAGMIPPTANGPPPPSLYSQASGQRAPPPGALPPGSSIPGAPPLSLPRTSSLPGAATVPSVAGTSQPPIPISGAPPPFAGPPQQQTPISGGAPPSFAGTPQPPVSGAPSAFAGAPTVSQFSNWPRPNAPVNGPGFPGTGSVTMQPTTQPRPQLQQTPTSGAPPSFTARPLSSVPPQAGYNASVVQPPPTAASGTFPPTAGYNASVMPPPPTAASGTYPGVPPQPTWAGAPPTFSTPSQPQRPQTLPAMPSQTSAPMPPASMNQYLSQGVSQPGSPATSGGGSSRIDPTQIPRPQPSSALISFETRVNGQAALPPSATSNYIVRDTGNCSPRYMRCTLNQVPTTGDMLSNSSMPLALMVQPLALPHPSEEPIQLVDFGESGPVRCNKCKAYINPFMKFIDQGHRFKCNLCGQVNDTPREYHCNLGPDNRRRDADHKPELCRGTVEFVATKEFLVRPPMHPLFFFLIDVSMNAVATGATAAACSAVQRALGDIPAGPHVKVGIATFDNTLHFYNFSHSQQPSMLVVPDVQDVYTPLQSGLTVSVAEFREQLEQLLENIPSMFQGTMIADSAFAAAVKGAGYGIKSNGGKLFVFQSGLPSVGYGALTARDSESKKGPQGEKDQNKLWQPADKTMKTLAIELAEFQVCCDLFLTTQEYVDVASLSVIPSTTGGQTYYYYPFSATSDSAKLYNDLRWNITRPQGMEAVMRVRCSQGLQVQDYYGNFHKGTPTDLDLPAIDCDKSVMATFKYDDKLQDGSECCFQCALLYTTTFGERRIRVTTLSLPCTAVLTDVFRGADLDAQFTYFLKQAAQEAAMTPLPQLRDKMTNSCVNVLYTYRKYCAARSSSGQLILPEALKLLPLYTLAMSKSIGLRTDARTDDRCYWLSRISSIPTSLAIPVVYPRMFSIHDLSDKDIGDGILPECLYLSSENLRNEGIFLLETGEDAFIYAGKAASSDALFELFGVRSVNEMQANQFILQEFDNDASRKLVALVNQIRKERCSYLRLRWCRRGDPLEFLFFSLLVEDKNTLGLSYVEYLVHVHRQIQAKLS